MKITKANQNQYPNEEIYQFYTVVKTAFEAITVMEDVFPSDLWAKFLKLYDDLNISLEQVLKSYLTEQVKIADKKRDATFKALRILVNTFAVHPNEAKREASTIISIILKKYTRSTDITDQNYDRETAAIRNIIEDLRDKHADKIILLAIGEWVQILEDQNNECDSLIIERDKQKSEQSPLKAKDVRKEINACYANLVLTLEAYMLANPGHGLESIINELNTSITRYKNRLAQKQGRKADKNNPEIEA